MRLVRLERQQSRVADDIRAALASLGRGSTVIGGVALVGVGGVTERPIEAVVVLPHGVIIVIGVDLPDPALRLEAPLGGPWKADGWPLVADDDSVNPATEALDVSQACERHVAALVPGTAPVGTIIAVGPYVETVDQPAADLAGPVRVLHPTPTTMLAATVSLATAHRPRSVDQARALIRGLAPSAPELSDEVLLGEGFSRLTDDAPPESLWDEPAAVPPPAAISADTPVSASPAGWRTKTPVEAEPQPELPAPDPQEEPGHPVAPAARPVFPGTETTSPSPEAERTEVIAPPTQAPDPAPRPVFPGTETAESPRSGDATPPDDAEPAESSAAETERTENLRLPAPDSDRTAAAGPAAEARPAEPAPAAPEAAETERTENLRFPAPGSDRTAAADPAAEARPAEPAPAAPEATPPERTENLRLPAPDSDRTTDLGLPAEAGQAPEHPAPRSPEAEQAAPGPTAPEQPAQARPAPEPTGPQEAEAGPGPSPAQAALPPLPSAAPQPFPRPRPKPEPAAAPKTVRWLPLGAIGALVLLAVAAIAVATTGDGTAAAPAPPPASTATAAPVTTPVRSLRFDLRAAGGDQRCASHAFGDAQASLQQTSCSGVKRASYAATVDGRAGAVTVGIVEFPDAGQAAAFKAVTDTPGGGGVLDLATETGQWGATPAPRFENAAYASKLDGSSVRIVQAVWAPGPSTPDDPGLVRAAAAALDLPAR
ncbi:hypothetical protein ACWED2_28840 [Amycolatopsis sp. NPDC005003]